MTIRRKVIALWSCALALAGLQACWHFWPMRRVMVMGPPGSGKSTLAREVGARYDLPVFHLDQAFWQPGWIEQSADTFRAEVERIAALPAWVIDGNYLDTIGPRLRAADTLIYLDVPTLVCMFRILRRIAASHGEVRIDSAAGCPEGVDFDFLRFAWGWSRTRRARHLALVREFAGRKIVLRGRHGLRDGAGSKDDT
jgi:adenylate kinase family enzyme